VFNNKQILTDILLVLHSELFTFLCLRFQQYIKRIHNRKTLLSVRPSVRPFVCLFCLLFTCFSSVVIHWIWMERRTDVWYKLDRPNYNTY